MPETQQTSFLFDLDGTLVDSVYQHVLAWQEALKVEGIPLSVWRIHRKIGMSGGLFANMLLRETGATSSRNASTGCASCTPRPISSISAAIRPLPGARELLAYLTEAGIPWAIAHQRPDGDGRGRSWRIWASISNRVPVVTRDQVKHAKPDPDLFLAAAERLGVPIETARVVGDSVWDMLAARRARALGIGLLAGGYGQDELERAGAYRVYEDPTDLLKHIDEVGGRAEI